MNYLTWKCPDCGKQPITYHLTRSTSGYLLFDGTEYEELADEGEWVFGCSGCEKEVVDEEGNSFTDHVELLSWLESQEE